jgi:hypothetical protein
MGSVGKDELIHLHGLLVELMKEMKEKEDLDDDYFEEYKEVGVGPNEIHKSKEEHKEAIFKLGGLLAEVSNSSVIDQVDNIKED